MGVQALTRFLSEGGEEVADWFAQARDQHLESDLEFAALESALAAARLLPDHLYVALKLSAATCLDPLLPGVLEDSPLAPGRLVLELTEAMTREQPAALLMHWIHCAGAGSGSELTTPDPTSRRSAISGNSGRTSSNWTATLWQALIRIQSVPHWLRPWSDSPTRLAPS